MSVRGFKFQTYSLDRLRVREFESRQKWQELCRGHLKCVYTHAQTTFRLSAKRTIRFKSAGQSFFRLLAFEICASAVVILDKTCSNVV